ncbi:MAG: substrate binding domain-containing protein [Sedimentitalea sp.]
MLRSAEAGLNELNTLSLDPVGALKISLPAFLTAGPLSTAIADFARKHPNVAFSVSYSDLPLNLVEDRFDMTIRVGWLDDSAMMSRKLADGQRVLVVGTQYAQARKTPRRPADLEDWDWIRYQQRADTTQFTSANGEIEKVTGKAQIEVDSIDAVYHFAVQNMGATILPSFLAERGIKSGELTRLLPDWTLRGLGIYAVWPDKSRRESLTMLFLRFLTEQGLCAPDESDA